MSRHKPLGELITERAYIQGGVGRLTFDKIKPVSSELKELVSDIMY